MSVLQWLGLRTMLRPFKKKSGMHDRLLRRLPSRAAAF
jgi:hypothetical protein